MLDRDRPLWAHDHVLKRRAGVSMFNRRCHQPPEPGAITLPELHTQIHNHVTAYCVSKNRRAGRVNQSLARGVFHVDTAKDDYSARIGLLPQKQHPQQHITT